MLNVQVFILWHYEYCKERKDRDVKTNNVTREMFENFRRMIKTAGERVRTSAIAVLSWQVLLSVTHMFSSKSFSLRRCISVRLKLFLMTNFIGSLSACRLLVNYAARMLNDIKAWQLSPTNVLSKHLAISNFTCKEQAKHISEQMK